MIVDAIGRAEDMLCREFMWVEDVQDRFEVPLYSIADDMTITRRGISFINKSSDGLTHDWAGCWNEYWHSRRRNVSALKGTGAHVAFVAISGAWMTFWDIYCFVCIQHTANRLAICFTSSPGWNSWHSFAQILLEMEDVQDHPASSIGC
jgi:hypothetical protein